MKKIPFIFGKVVTSTEFTGREKEVATLMSNFRMQVNTLLVSPCGWEKTSLVNKVCELLTEERDLKICSIDLSNVRKEEEFYVALAAGVLQGVSSRWEEMTENARKFLPRLMPRITFSPDAQTELSFGMTGEELRKNPDDVLDLAETIAEAKGIRLVVCMDEFQSITGFRDSLAFQKKLKTHWQRHQRVSYCLYGSKRHMLLEFFSDPSMPLYKFGDLMILEKIGQTEWVHFIQKRFADTGKQISSQSATLIAELADNHPYYVQQLAQQVWFRTAQVSNDRIVRLAHESLVNQLSLLFTHMTETLSATQLGFLKALLMDEKQFMSQAILRKYNLGTSGNVTRIRQALLSREMIDVAEGKIVFQDPMYRHWMKVQYCKI